MRIFLGVIFSMVFAMNSYPLDSLHARKEPKGEAKNEIDGINEINGTVRLRSMEIARYCKEGKERCPKDEEN